MSTTITADTTIEELLRLVPEASVLLRQHGIVCIQCGEPVWGTLGEVAADKGISDLQPIIAELASLPAR